MAVLLVVMVLAIRIPAYAEATAPPANDQQVAPAAGPAPEIPAIKESKPAAEKIAIASDRATINRADRTIKLVGHVQVHQGDTLITSDSLTLFLKEGAKIDTPGAGSENAIERIIADGNVIFKLDIGTAYSDHAEYVTQTRLLVLTGKTPKFVSRDNTITGSRITVNRDTGMVTFDGGKGRVEAIIYSKDRL
jgi:lipopolysaccharide transport protein LptA